MSEPENPIAAVTHADPYPYYARLVRSGGLAYDASLDAWIAADAATVTSVLTTPALAVRPPTEKIPRALAGSRAGDIFGSFMRMDDTSKHDLLRESLDLSLPTLATADIRAVAQRFAEDARARAYDEIVFGVPIRTVASLLGLPDEDLADAVAWTRAFVRANAPGATPEEITTGSKAAEYLFSLVTSQLAGTRRGALLPRFASNVEQVGCPQRDAVSNAIGLLVQTADATAGSIGNTIVRLQRDPPLAERVTREFTLLPKIIAEVLRWDPPIHNTRRFAAQAVTIGKVDLKAGQAVVAILAAANRDPLANDRPDAFETERVQRRTFTFGSGLHACPGERLALAISEATIRSLIESGGIARFGGDVSYQSSTNARIPIFN